MFKRSPELDKGVKIMNAVEDGKFPLMLNRIAQFLSADTSAKPFTDAEESKLETSLEISRNDVRLLIDAIVDIFNKCAYHMIKPAALAEHLASNLEMDQKKAEAFAQVWTSFAKGIVDTLKQKPFLPQLNDMSYMLSVETASNLESQEKIPKAQLQLGLSNDKKREEVNVEFNHDELYSFYKKLEQIQDQLDALR